MTWGDYRRYAVAAAPDATIAPMTPSDLQGSLTFLREAERLKSVLHDLGYGQKHMGSHPLLLQIRALLDADTRSRHASSA